MINPLQNEDILAYNQYRKNIFLLKSDIKLENNILIKLKTSQLPFDNFPSSDAIQLLRYYYPELRWTEFSPGKTGRFHKIIFLKSNTGNEIVLRINRLSDLSIDYSLYYEEMIQPVLKAFDVLTPEIYKTDCSRKQHSFDYQIQSYLKGKTLSEFDRNDENIIPKLEVLSHEMLKIHQIQGEGFGPLQLAQSSDNTLRGVHSNWTEYLTTNLNDHLNICLSESVINKSEYQLIEKTFDIKIEADSRLLHADLGNHNLFYFNNRIGFIDWEDVILGDPLFDLAMLASFHPERRWKHIFDCYLSSLKTSKIAPTQEISYRFWLYFLRIAIFKTVHRIRFGISDNPERPKSSLRIQRAIRAMSHSELLPVF